MNAREDCPFCGIVAGDVASEMVYSDDQVVVVVSAERLATVHLLLISRRHVPSVDALTTADRDLWWHMLEVAQRLARNQGIDVGREGYFLSTNAGRHDIREFPHLHLDIGSGALG